jgi:ABC-type transport system substrate-binding protein
VTARKPWIACLIACVMAWAGVVGDAQAQKAGGRLVIAQGTDAESLDTIAFTASPTAAISEHITETLVRMEIAEDARTGEIRSEVRGRLAESWQFAPDGTALTLRLRKGVKFHDGTDLDAESVQLSLERTLNPACAAPFRAVLLGRIPYTPASLTTGEVANKNAIVWTAKLIGADGNGIAVALKAGPALKVAVTGTPHKDPTVAVDFVAGTTTAADVIKAVNDDKAASAVISAANAKESDGSGPVTAVAAAKLAGYRSGVEAVDASTVRLTVPTPFAPLLAHLTHSAIGITSAKRLRAAIAALPPCGRGLEDQPAGTGPFMVKEWRKLERLVLAKNPAYWDKDAAGRALPYLEELEWRVIPDDAARMIELEKGTVHVAVRVPPLDVPRLQRAPDLGLDFTTSVRTIFIGLNARDRVPDKEGGAPNPLADKRVRQALNHCVDKEAIVKTILGGQARVSDAPIVPQVFGYHKVGPYAFDSAKAADLLRDAGVKTPFKLKLHTPRGRYVRDVQVAQAVQAMLGTCGVDVELTPLEFVAYLAFINKPAAEAEHQMYLLGWGTVTVDGDYGLYSLFHSSQWPPGPFNRGYYKSDAVDKLLDEARASADPEARKKLYAEAQRLIWDDAPWLFLHSESQITGIRKVVKGLNVHVTERVIAWHAWLE